MPKVRNTVIKSLANQKEDADDSVSFIDDLKKLQEEICQSSSDSDDNVVLLSKDNEFTGHEDEAVVEKKAAWFDEDDAAVSEKITEYRGRKLVGDGRKDYGQVLEEKYESVMGVPKWAQKTTKQDGEEFFSSTGSMVKKSTSLEKGLIDIQKITDMNKETYNEGPIIRSVLFHPSSTVGLVAGVSGTASLFQIDGKENTKLQSIQFKKFPINCTAFLRNGEEFIVGSRFKDYFYSHDLISGRSIRVTNNKLIDITHVKTVGVTPNGKYLVILGRFGAIHMLSAKTKEHICTLRMNDEVKALSFHGSTMYTHGVEGKVFIWDLNTRRCVHQFIDEGCLGGTSLDVSPNGKFLACGSTTGIVNIYDTTSIVNRECPQPIKTLYNLVTKVGSVKFNSTSEILCMASAEKHNAVKLLHCPSMTVFANFPSPLAQFNRVQCVDFSPNSGFFAFGDNLNTAHLFRLKYYGNY